MAEGSLVYSHVPSDGGALLHEADGGLLLYRKTRIYWNLRFTWSFESDYEGSPPDYENESWIPHGMVRDAAGRYHLDWPVKDEYGNYVATSSQNVLPFDFLASPSMFFCVLPNGDISRTIPASRDECTLFDLYHNDPDFSDGLRVTVYDEYGLFVSTGQMQTTIASASVSATLSGPRYGSYDFAVTMTLSALPHHPLCIH